MKTPTNFIPIIGPLYADDLHLVVKSDGYSEEKYDVKAKAKLNPLYFVNILNASIGMWIDLGTGAHIKPEKEVNFEMKKNN